MMSIDRIAAALRVANISLEEKEAWLNLIPHLTEEELETVILSFEEEREELDALRATYLARVQMIVDKVQADETKARVA